MQVWNVCRVTSEDLGWTEENGGSGPQLFPENRRTWHSDCYGLYTARLHTAGLRTAGLCMAGLRTAGPLIATAAWDSETQTWPAQRDNFRGEFVYFKPHPGSWVGFLCDGFVFCIQGCTTHWLL